MYMYDIKSFCFLFVINRQFQTVSFSVASEVAIRTMPGRLNNGYNHRGYTVDDKIDPLMISLLWICSRRTILYVVVQTVGAITGAGVLKGLSANNTNNGLCTPGPSEGVSNGQVFGIEMFITFILVFTVFATCDSLRTGFSGSGPLAIGLSLTMCHLWAVSIYVALIII